MHRQTGRRPALLAALLTAGWAAAQGGGPTDKGDPNKQLALALVDGSVRGVGYSITFSTLIPLLTPTGGEVVTLD